MINKPRKRTGRINIKMARKSGGNTPEIMPGAGVGALQIHSSQWNCAHRSLMLESVPTNATGNAHSTIRQIVRNQDDR
jgi:hypothetical protein